MKKSASAQESRRFADQHGVTEAVLVGVVAFFFAPLFMIVYIEPGSPWENG